MRRLVPTHGTAHRRYNLGKKSERGDESPPLNVLAGQRVSVFPPLECRGDGWRFKCAIKGAVMSTALIETAFVSHEALPVCLPLSGENPYSLVTLANVLQVYAHLFVKLIDDLRSMEAEIPEVWSTWDLTGNADGATKRFDFFKTMLSGLKKNCEALGLRSALKQLRRFEERENSSDLSFDEVAAMMSELRRRIVEDLEDTVFYCVPVHKVGSFFERATDGELRGELVPKTFWNLFGEKVSSNFSPAVVDIEESAQCLVTGRNTAAVFHLMRVMEVALRVLGKSLNDPSVDPKHNPSWEAILKKCDTEIARPLNDRCKEWRDDERFYSEATANLRAVKNAWRNPTMHVEITYDEHQASVVWNAVKGFMEHLATKLQCD